MHKHTHLLCGLLGLMTIQGQAQARTVHPINNDPWFREMHSSMRSMHEHMIKGMQEMQQAFDEFANAMPDTSTKSAERQTVTLDANDMQVIITLDVPGAKTDAMKAERSLDRITIDVPQEHGSTLVRLSTHALSIDHKEESKKDDAYSAVSHSYMERTLPHVIDMSGDIAIEHAQDSNKLTITLARKHPTRAPQQLSIFKK